LLFFLFAKALVTGAGDGMVLLHLSWHGAFVCNSHARCSAAITQQGLATAAKANDAVF
jgi:hypothetical protein